MRSKLLIVFFLLCICSGCTTLNARHNTRARESIALGNIESDLRRLTEKVNGLVDAQQEIYRELENLKRVQTRTDAEQRGELKKLEARVKTSEEAAAGLKRDIIADLSKKIAELLASSAPRNQRGREHVVKQGQTLSEIAGAYGVQVGAIVRANKLKNANAIKVGQKLFIPDP